MEIKSRYIGNSIIEITVSTNNTSMTEDITDINSYIDENFIENLRNLADELEEHNEKKNK